MSAKHPAKSVNPPACTVLLMSAAIEASDLIRQLADPCPAGDSVKAAINRALRRVSPFLPWPMKPSRAEDIWRREARAIRAEEMDALRAAKAAKEKAEFKHEAAAVEARLARIEAALFAADEDFHGPAIDALRRASRPFGKAFGEVK